ncbi:diaminobutyrate acetyltransferase [Marinimicrococcus flavescens]|uniref:L-2,4-diaminobutyric acid acetyltransferase n=1 Tax=Marinimicrococcus flavescens TaxID=3031815 RepID=A0AAP3UY92_9PROT|nr:diaminobutyrate acetyltransferase [Marinimicrococcus flavescens]
MHLIKQSHRPKAEDIHAEIVLRRPTAEDGEAVNALIGSSGALDENSLYCNLLQCTHFADTCRLAERDGEVVGWVSGYLPPAEPDTLFIWQVAVSASARGKGLAKRLVTDLLRDAPCRHVRRIKTTITPDNAASWALFHSVAEGFGAPLTHRAWFERDAHFGGQHDTEHLVAIGPFGSAARTA